MHWKFIAPAAPHQIACAEALVNTYKSTLKKAVVSHYSQHLSYMLLPRGTQSDEPKTHQRSPNDPHNGSYLCPNEILLGHASSEVPHGPFKEKNPCHKVPRDHLKNH